MTGPVGEIPFERTLLRDVTQRGDDFAERQPTSSERAPILVDAGRHSAVAQVNDADVGYNSGKLTPLAVSQGEVIRVVRQFQERAAVFLNQIDNRAGICKKRPIRCAGRVHRLQGERDVDGLR